MSALLQPEQVVALERIAREAPDETYRRRARLLLLYHEGKPTREVAAAVGLSPSRTTYWRRAFLKEGMAIFPPEVMGDAVPQPAPARRRTAARKTGTAARKGTRAKRQPAPRSDPAPEKKATPAPEPPSLVETLTETVTEALSETVPALLPKKVRKKAEKLADEVRDVVGKKALKKIEEIRTEEAFRSFLSLVQKQRKKLKKQLKARDLKKKQIKFLRKQLKILEAQIDRAEKLLQKLEG